MTPESNAAAVGMNKTNACSLWTPVFIYCLLIFIQSSLPMTGVPTLGLGDKSLHFLAYALMGFLFFRAFRGSFARSSISRIAMLSALSVTIFGISDEIHQAFVPQRTADIYDVAADIIGGVAAVLLACLMHSRRADWIIRRRWIDK